MTDPTHVERPSAAPEQIPAVLCIDVEPDPRRVPVPSIDGWPGFSGLLELIEPLRDLLAERSGRPAHFGWFLRMDPQVEVAYGDARWVAQTHGAELARLVDTGDELGLHPHSWRWVDDHWVSDQADAAWVAHCADVSLDAYADAFGVPCRAYRHGDRFTSDALLAHLAARGVRVDLTPEPGLPPSPGLVPEEPATGMLPGVPVEHSRPRRLQFPESGDMVILPLTTAPALGRDPGGARFASETLTLWTAPRLFAARLEARLQDPALDHLAFAVRSELGLHEVAWSFFEQNLEHLSRRLGDRIEWTAPSAAAVGVPHGPATPGWPSQTDLPTVLASYGVEIEATLSDLERELVLLRGQHAGELARSEAAMDSLQRSLVEVSARADDLEVAVAELSAALAELRGTVTWRVHDRLLPALRLAARVLRRR